MNANDPLPPIDPDPPPTGWPTRRQWLQGAAGAALLAGGIGVPSGASAQGFATRPLRMTIAFPPAGATDILARTLGESLAAALGQQVVVDNKPGAGGMIGLEAAAKSPADGHHLFLCALTNQAIAGHLYPKATSDITRDFEPVALLASAPHLLNVNPAVPAKNLREFVAWLKANEGKATYASQGNGTLSHLEAELLGQRVGVKLTHVPYRGSSQAVPDLISGTVPFMFDSVAASIPFIKSGQLRGLAVASSQRVPTLPDVPTIAEAGVAGYDVDNWFGLYVPKGTPTDIVKQLHAVVARTLAEPAMIASLVQKGFIVFPGDGARLGQLTATERAKWGAVIKAANVTI